MLILLLITLAALVVALLLLMRGWFRLSLELLGSGPTWALIFFAVSAVAAAMWWPTATYTLPPTAPAWERRYEPSVPPRDIEREPDDKN